MSEETDEALSDAGVGGDSAVQGVLMSTPYSVLLVDENGTIVFANDSACELLGYPLSELVGVAVERLVPESMAAGHEKLRAAFLADPSIRQMGSGRDLAVIAGDGREVPVEISLSPLVDGGRSLTMAVIVDLTARRKAETKAEGARHRLERSEELHRGLVESAPIGIFRSAPAGSLLYANPALVRILGYDTLDEVIGMDLKGAYADPQARERVLAGLEGKSAWHGLEVELKRPNGEHVTCLVTARVVLGPDGGISYYEGTLEDVTQRRSMETELRKMRRMESATRLAAGLQHSLNNVLTSITGNVQLAIHNLPDVPDLAKEDLIEAEDGLLAAAGMLARLRSFSAVAELRLERLDLAEFARTWTETRTLPKGSRFEVDTPDEPVLVDVDPPALEAMVSSIQSNAVEAMGEGGRLRFVVDPSPTHLPGFVELAISDDGAGMEANVLERAFEPFFSTKNRVNAVDGAGFGLSLVYGLARQHGGDAEIESRPGEGTTVRLRLPKPQV